MHSIRKIYTNPNLIRKMCSLRSVCALNVGNNDDGKKTMCLTNKVCLPLKSILLLVYSDNIKLKCVSIDVRNCIHLFVRF